MFEDDTDGTSTGEKLFEDRPLLKQFQTRRSRGIKLCATIWDRAKENHAFAAPGESQWEERDKKAADKNKATALSFNEIHPIVQHLSGRQIMDRYQRVYIPRNRSAAEWAEALTDIDRAVVENCDAAQEESRAFYSGPCVSGVGWLAYSLDFLEDPEGMLTIREVPIWSMIWPADETRRMNLSDRTWHIHGFWLPKAEVRARWPRHFKKIQATLGMHWSKLGDESRPSSRIPWRPVEGMADEQVSFYDRSSDNFWIERYEYREIEFKFHVITLLNEALTYEEAEAAIARQEIEQDAIFKVQIFSPEEFEALNEGYHVRTGSDIPRAYIKEHPAYVYKYALFAGEEILEQGNIPVGRWTMLAVTGYPFEQPEMVSWRSVVDALRDPQLWKNVFTSMLLRFMQINPKGLLIHERGLFRNRNEAMSQWTSFGGTLEVERGKLQGGNPGFQIVSGAGSPMNGLLESMVGMADAAIPRLAGFNPGALGQVGNDLRRISGEVVSQVREAAAAAQAMLFDALKLYRKQGGETLLAFVARFFDDDDIVRIIGEAQAYEPVVNPETGEPEIDEQGQPVLRSKIPPKEVWDSANWRLSVQDQTPAPDRLRAQFEALSASGGLKLMVDTGALINEDLAMMMPDMLESHREKILARIRSAQQEEGRVEDRLELMGQVMAELVQSAANLPDEQKQALLAALQGEEPQQAAA